MDSMCFATNPTLSCSKLSVIRREQSVYHMNLIAQALEGPFWH